MYKADSDMEGDVVQVQLEPEVSGTVSISSNDGGDSTKELDSEYYSELDSDVDTDMEDYVDAPYSM
jgi:hypothetical protein